jgi:hypothetical protein
MPAVKHDERRLIAGAGFLRETGIVGLHALQTILRGNREKKRWLFDLFETRSVTGSRILQWQDDFRGLPPGEKCPALSCLFLPSRKKRLLEVRPPAIRFSRDSVWSNPRRSRPETSAPLRRVCAPGSRFERGEPAPRERMSTPVRIGKQAMTPTGSGMTWRKPGKLHAGTGDGGERPGRRADRSVGWSLSFRDARSRSSVGRHTTLGPLSPPPSEACADISVCTESFLPADAN